MITSLDFIVKGADIKGLPTKEQISQGYTHFNLLTPRNDNPKLFAWEFLYTDYLVEAVKHWQNQVLVDLGCGRQLDGYIIAKLAGASAYVAVDPYNINKFYQRLISDKESKGDKDFNERIRRVRKLVQKRGYDEKTISTIVNNIDAHLEGNHLPVALIAEDMISALTLAFNQARQSAITTELADITGGRAAIEAS